MLLTISNKSTTTITTTTNNNNNNNNNTIALTPASVYLPPLISLPITLFYLYVVENHTHLLTLFPVTLFTTFPHFPFVRIYLLRSFSPHHVFDIPTPHPHYSLSSLCVMISPLNFHITHCSALNTPLIPYPLMCVILNQS